MFVFASVWFAAVVVLGFFRGRRLALGDAVNWVAVVPAHNESRVVGRVVRSIVRQGVRCVVVADRCTDGTAAEAYAGGAEVWEREVGAGGKPGALRWAFERLAREAVVGGWSAVAVFDADNVVGAGWFARMSRTVGGAGLAQSFVGALAPRGVVARSYAAVAVAGGVWMRGRERLGLPVILGGTGWAVRRDVLERVPFACVSLTEDLEYSVAAAAAGVRGVYVSEAVTYDEKPERLTVAHRQRSRWQRGGVQVLLASLRSLVRVGQRSPFAAAELAWFLLSPLVAVVGWIGLVTSPLSLAVNAAVWWGIVAGGVLVLRVPVSQWWVGVLTPFYMVTAVPALIWGLLTWRGRSWYSTPHGV